MVSAPKDFPELHKALEPDYLEVVMRNQVEDRRA
jgi:hypothetical protein